MSVSMESMELPRSASSLNSLMIPSSSPLVFSRAKRTASSETFRMGSRKRLRMNEAAKTEARIARMTVDTATFLT